MSAKFSILGVAVVVVIPIPFACGGYEGGKINPPAVDAAIDAMEPCKGADSYSPSFGSDDVVATNVPEDIDQGVFHQQYFSALLNDQDPPDVLYIDLFADYGVFEGGDIVTGTFPLQGDDTNYSTCGACVTVAADDVDGVPDDWYMAFSGILTLSNVTTGMTGTLQNVRLRRVITDSEGAPSDTSTGDCATVITSASFDASFAGSGSAMRRVRVMPHVRPNVLRNRVR